MDSMNEALDPKTAAIVRLDNINGDIEEIKVEQKEQGIRIRLVQIDMASIKTEVRILGALILTIVTALIIIYITNLI